MLKVNNLIGHGARQPAAASGGYTLDTWYYGGSLQLVTDADPDVLGSVSVGDAPGTGEGRLVAYALIGDRSGGSEALTIKFDSASTFDSTASSGFAGQVAYTGFEAAYNSGTSIQMEADAILGNTGIDVALDVYYRYYDSDTYLPIIRASGQSALPIWGGDLYIQTALGHAAYTDTLTLAETEYDVRSSQQSDATADYVMQSQVGQFPGTALDTVAIPTFTGTTLKYITMALVMKDITETPAITSSSTGSGGAVTAGNNISVTLPATVNAGDWLVVHVAARGDGAAANYTAPSGWSVATNSAANFGNTAAPGVVCFVKQADGTEDSSSINIAVSTNNLLGYAYHARSISGTAGFMNAGSSASNGGGTSIDVGASGPNAYSFEKMYFCQVVHETGDTTAYPSNFTASNLATAAGGGGHTLNTSVLVSTGTTADPNSFTLDSATSRTYTGKVGWIY